jgi:FkbM family methyltransferase
MPSTLLSRTKTFARRLFPNAALQSLLINIQLHSWTRFDQRALEFYSSLILPGGLCFDIGANIGNRVKIFLKLGSRVIAVEPQDKCIKILRRVFGTNPNLTIVEQALGHQEGFAQLSIGDACTLSSLSSDWIDAVRKSGRFSEYSWSNTQNVSVTTIDALIHKFGLPDFIKVDVEGYELQVIKGLSQPVRMISLEFTPEYLDSTFQSIDLLKRLGPICLNYSLGESMRLALHEWTGPEQMITILSGFKNDAVLFGDIYVRYTAGMPHNRSERFHPQARI